MPEPTCHRAPDPRARARWSRPLRGALLLLLTAVLARGATFSVTTTADLNVESSALSLRMAIILANGPAHPGPDTILLPAGTYHLTLPGAGEDVSLTGDLDITDDLVIKGDGAATTIIDATGLGDRVLQVIAGNVKISGVTLRGGQPPDGSGGGILNSGNLELTDCVIADNNAANSGGGISNRNYADLGVVHAGTLKLTRCVLQNNGLVVPSAAGGALFSATQLTVADCAFTNNFGSYGGAVYAGGTSDVRRSMFAGNTATPNEGGAIFVPVGGRLNLVDCTLAGNTSTSAAGGGALATTTNVAAPPPAVSVLNCTFADNTAPNATAGATVAIFSGSATFENTILRQPGTIPSVNVPPASRGHNLTSDAFGPAGGPGDLLNTDPRLGPLQDNGGPTATLAPLPGSPAIDAGANDAAPFTDQRGFPCWVGAAVDIGAVETQRTFWVTTINDSGPGSWRQAVLEVNQAAGDANSILFNIAGAGPFRIQPQSALPALTRPAVVDGYSQPGASPNTLAFGDNAAPQIVLDGGALPPASAAGLQLNADSSAVRGLVIQGHFSIGVQVNAGQARLEGNFIGTDESGTLGQPNNQGIALSAGSHDTVIGGSTPAARNLVSGNTGAGIYVDRSTGNRILGNYLGTDASGLAALGNGGSGIELQGDGNTLGGADASARNIIAHNLGSGINITGAGNAVLGNTISSNTAAGVTLESTLGPATGNAIEGNSISANGALGIDLGGTGAALANDPGDADSGPNQLQNHPDLSFASPANGQLQIQYSVPSDPANSSYPLTVEFFIADGAGQGMTPLGRATYPPLLAGRPATAVLTATLTGTDRIVATATDAAGNTSEFSPPVPINQPPTINLAFEAPANFAHTAGSPQTVVAHDLDGDGYPEVVLNDPSSGNVWVWPNTSQGHGSPADWLGAPLKFATGISPVAVAVADLDGDGKPDLVTVSSTGGLSVLLNVSTPGTLAFNSPATVIAGVSGVHLALADLDGDGRPDVVLVGGGGLTILRNLSSPGTIAFAAPVVLPAAADAEFVAIADLDGDGRNDLVVVNRADQSLSLFRNETSGPGGFTAASFGAPRIDLSMAGTPTSVAIGDFDLDGKPDLAVSLRDAASVAVLRNTASSGTLSATSFAPPLVFPTGIQPVVVATADLDGDGKLDLVTADGSGPTATTLRNTSSPGQISFQPLGQFAVHPNPLALAVGDLNHDGRPDLVVSQPPPTSGGGTLSILANNPALLPLPLSGSPSPLTIPFALGDAETPADQLIISVISSNPDVIPPSQVQVQTLSGGNRNLIITPAAFAAGDAEITVTVTDAAGNRTSNTIRVSVGCGDNTSWPNACPVPLTAVQPNVIAATLKQSLDEADQSRWYRFAVQPGSQVVVALTDLPANYDLFLFGDIHAAYLEMAAPTEQDLVKLGAEYAPAAFSPAAFSGDAYSPAAFSPAAFSPAAFSPAAFSPAAFSPAAFSPAAFSPAAFSPAAFSPAAFSPAAFSPAAFSPAAFSSASASPAAFSPAAFSGAQTRSLVGVSAFDGTAGEGIVLNTWDNTGDFYICVRGRSGAAVPDKPFRLDIVQNLGACGGLTPLPAATTTPTAGGYKTIILTDVGRMNPLGDPTVAAAIVAMQTRLQAFAARPEVQGVIVDVGADAAVQAANAQADARFRCVAAKNLVADAIHNLITAYLAINPTLSYVVIVGNDHIIPFYRYPDSAGLANEENYIPPVFDSSASQASLRLGQVLTQDGYGAVSAIVLHGLSFPVPDLAVGRLVETPDEVSGLLDAYATTGGAMAPPAASLVTGYDFMTGTAEAIEAQLVLGMGNDAGTRHDTLIAPRELSPQADPMTTANWTAAELGTLLNSHRYDIMFLAGHYNAGAALAADWVTELTAADVAASAADMTGSLVYGAGCHVAYNLVDQDSIPNVTQNPDWAQAFARKRVGAFIGGTGYQYGDTEFVEYSDRLYLEFTRQLLLGTGPVSLGQAFVAAKQQYLADTPQLLGIHEKALLEATFFGFPMLSLNLPNGRGTPPPPSSIVAGLTAFTALPGAPVTQGGLGLEYADVDINTLPLTVNSVTLTVYPQPAPPAPGTVVATYLSGRDGQVTAPAEPVLPRVVADVTVPDNVLRGVGFREGDYTDETGVRALTGAPATEIRGVSVPAQADFFDPPQPWSINYFDALSDPASGRTRLDLFPAQYQSSAPGSDVGVRRAFSRMKLRLYYSTNTTVFTDTLTGSPITPALAAAPVISSVAGQAAGNTIAFSAQAVGDPSAGLAEVWITYTAVRGALAGVWRSLELEQRTDITTTWQGTLTLPADGTVPGDVRFMVQAANGVGLVALDTQQGYFYTPVDPAAPPPTTTTLTFDSFPLSGRYGETPTVSAVLATANGPVSGQRVVFGLGMQRQTATTDANGRAAVNLQLLGEPGAYLLQATFAGNASLATASATTQFTIQAAHTSLSLLNLTTTAPSLNVVGTLTDGAGAPLSEKTVFFLITDGANHVLAAKAVITDYAGRAALGRLPVSAGIYTVTAAFNTTIPLPPGAGVPQLILQDGRFDPAQAAGQFTFTLVASDQTIQRQSGLGFQVPISTILANVHGLASPPPQLDSVDAVSAQGVPVQLDLVAGAIVYLPDPSLNYPDHFHYTISDGQGQHATGLIYVTILPPGSDNSPTSNIISLTPGPAGAVTVTCLGQAFVRYSVQATDSLAAPVVWTTLGTMDAGWNGQFAATDTGAPNHIERFYRAISP